MFSQSYLFRHTRLAFFAVLLGLILPAVSQAGGIICGDSLCYGDFMGDTVWYRMVTETANTDDDTEPLFGMPTVSGNTLDFDPVGFGASASGAGGNDMTDGQLTFMVEAKQGNAIQNIKLQEAGDVTLSGFSPPEAFASVTTAVFIDIEQVDGAGIDPIKLQLSMPFGPSGGDYFLSSDGGGGPLFNTIWMGMLFVNIQQELIDNNIPFNLGATKISVNLDNTLVAVSQAGTSALIAKKDADGIIITTNIPEPASCLLAMLGLAFGATLARRSRR